MSSTTLRSQAKVEATATRVSLPANEASKACFPPGCRVLCFDKTGFRVGTVKDVQVSISLPTGGTFGTYYDVEINGSPTSPNNRGRGKGRGVSQLFTESSLRFTPGCAVEVTADYFGSVFRFTGNGGKVQGTVIGCFEMPPSGRTRSIEKAQNLSSKRKYFYSVRVKFKGMDEAVEAHGVPPEHVCITTDSDGRALSEITGDYNAEVFDCFPVSQKDHQIRRPEDIPIEYTLSHDSRGYDSEDGSTQSYSKMYASKSRLMAKGFAGRYPSAEPSLRRLFTEQTDGSISPPRRSMKNVKSKARSLTPVGRNSRSLRGNLQSSASRVRLYKVGPGVLRPPSDDIPPSATKTKSNEGSKKGSQERQDPDSEEVDSRDDPLRRLDGYKEEEFRQVDEGANYLSDDLSDDARSIKEEDREIFGEKGVNGVRTKDTSLRRSEGDRDRSLGSEDHHHHDYEEGTQDENSLHKNNNADIYDEKQAHDWENEEYSQGSGFEGQGSFDHTYDSRDLDHQENSSRSHNNLDDLNESINEEGGMHNMPEEEHLSQPSPTNNDHYQKKIEDSPSSGMHSQLNNQDNPGSNKWVRDDYQVENQTTETSTVAKRYSNEALPLREKREKWGESNSSRDDEQSPYLPKRGGKRFGVSPSTTFEQKTGPAPFEQKTDPATKHNISKENTAVDNNMNRNSAKFNAARQTVGIGKVNKSVFEGESSSPPISLKPTTEGCYLSYITNNGGSMGITYSHSSVDGSIGFWYPGSGHRIQPFKFKQNQGRSDLIKNVVGRDFKKKYFSGWCQFIKAARKSEGVVVKWPNNGGLEVDLYVFYIESCEIKKLEDGIFCDVSAIDAVACIPAGNSTYNGVRKGEYNKFLNIGQGVGASIAIGGT